MSIANSRMTFGAILGAISTTAHTLSNTLEAANQGVGMLNTFVAAAATKQKITEAEDLELFTRTYEADKAREYAAHLLTIAQFREQSSQHASLYDQAYQELATARAARNKA